MGGEMWAHIVGPRTKYAQVTCSDLCFMFTPIYIYDSETEKVLLR